MNGGTCLREISGKRVPRGPKKNVRCNRSSHLTNSLPYKEGHRLSIRTQRLPVTVIALPRRPRPASNAH